MAISKMQICRKKTKPLNMGSNICSNSNFVTCMDEVFHYYFLSRFLGKKFECQAFWKPSSISILTKRRQTQPKLAVVELPKREK